MEDIEMQDDDVGLSVDPNSAQASSSAAAAAEEPVTSRVTAGSKNSILVNPRQVINHLRH